YELIDERLQILRRHPLHRPQEDRCVDRSASESLRQIAQHLREPILAESSGEHPEHHLTLLVRDRLVGTARLARVEPVTERDRAQGGDGAPFGGLRRQYGPPVKSVAREESRPALRRAQSVEQGGIGGYRFTEPLIVVASPSHGVAPPLVGHLVSDRE